jgi:hypothetical protein
LEGASKANAGLLVERERRTMGEMREMEDVGVEVRSARLAMRWVEWSVVVMSMCDQKRMKQ